MAYDIYILKIKTKHGYSILTITNA